MSSISTRIKAELRGDQVIWAILVLLSIFSVLAVYSATGTIAYRERGGNTEAFIFKHMVILGVGLMLTYLFHLMHYRRYSNWAPVLLAVSIPLLMYTILMGADINEARRWVVLPLVGITFQTSDLAKLALILYVARQIGSKQEYIKDFKSAFLPIIIPVLLVCALIAPANLSSALLLFLVCLAMMLVGRVAFKYIGLLLLLGAMVFTLLIMVGRTFPDYVRVETWENRVRDFMTESEDAYQVNQAKIAIANGGWIGKGPGNSIQRNYLPAPYSDFIYAIICEEYGVLGGAFIIALYLFLFFRITRLVTKSPKAFGAMAALGLGISLIFQAFINIAVSVNLVPVTGLTLPMVSMGGTSILFTCVAFGIILSVSKFIEAVS